MPVPASIPHLCTSSSQCWAQVLLSMFPRQQRGDYSFSLIKMCPYPGSCERHMCPDSQDLAGISVGINDSEDRDIAPAYCLPRAKNSTRNGPSAQQKPIYPHMCLPVDALHTAVSLAEGSSLCAAQLWNGCEPANPQRAERCLGCSSYCTTCQVEAKAQNCTHHS